MKVLSVVMAVVITAFVGIGSSFAGSEGAGKSGSHGSNSPPCLCDGPHDSEIISRVLSGDANAFEILVHWYSRLVVGIVGKHIPRDRVG